MKPILSFDVDMTLLDHKDWTIPASALDAIDQVRDRYMIVVASGRDMDNRYGAPYRDMIKPDAIIHMDGTRVTLGDQILFNHYMDKDLLWAVIEYADRMGYCVGFSEGDLDYYTHGEYLVERDMKLWGESGRNFQDLKKLLTLDVRTMSLLSLKEKAGKEISDMERKFPQLQFPVFSGHNGCDILERSISKATGMEILLKHLGGNMSQVIAFGDSMNDIEIISKAGIGVAMGNAGAEVKAAADYVTTDIDKEGILNAFRHLGLL